MALDALIADTLGRWGGRANAKVCEPEECKQRARAKVAALLETAQATAGIFSCSQQIFSVTQAQLTLINCKEAWKEFSAGLSEMEEAKRDRRKRAQSSRSVSSPAKRKSFPASAPRRKQQRKSGERRQKLISAGHRS